MRQRWIAASVVIAFAVIAAVIFAITDGHSARQRSSASRTTAGPTTSVVSQSSPTSAPTSQGPDAVPPGAWALPSPARVVGTVGVGYPDTLLGALAMGFNSLSAQVNVDPDIAASVVRATYLSPTPAQIQEAAQVVEEARSNYGLSPTGPTSATIDLSLEACKVESASADRVVAGFEGTLVVEGPSLQGTTSDFSKAVTLAWTGTDWRIDPNAAVAQPTIAFPSSAQATGEGWHPCSEV